MNWRWIFLMAWRDSRKNRSRLFLYISSIVLGVAAMVALSTFNRNLKTDIDLQAASLLGADLEIESRTQPNDEALAFIDSLKGLSLENAYEERFVSMVRFPRTNDSRLVQVRGIQGNYPFYGELDTAPKGGMKQVTDNRSLLMDNSLKSQFGVELGDTVQLGLGSFSMVGNILKAPGQTVIAASMTPSVVIPLQSLDGLGLKQEGSRVEYIYYFKFAADFDVDEYLEQRDDLIDKLQLRTSTVSTTKENTGRSFSDVTKFMQLVGFIALLLGAIGVSSAVHVYVREKMITVATLRCLGATAKNTFLIFLIQFAGIGILAGLLGAALGTLTQYLFPLVMQDFLPVSLSVGISWLSIGQGVLLGFIMSVLFALLPLVGVRHVSPLNTLRVESNTIRSGKRDPLRLGILLLIMVLVVFFARFQLDNWGQTLFFVLGVVLTFALLYATSQGLIYMIRKFFPKKWPYVWRQGLSNLYRPLNQTGVVILSVGFGTVLIATLFFVQNILLQRVQMGRSDGQPNMVLFDVQPSQTEPIKSIIRSEGIPVVEEVPIVTLQLAEINGHTLGDVLADSSSKYKPRAFRGEIRATYRDSLFDSETIVDGRWEGRAKPDGPALVSLEKRYADQIGVTIGDTLLLNVQGVRIPGRVTSLRQVDWNRFQTNFRMVLAKGTVDDAPQFYVLMARVEEQQQATELQQKIVNQYPNVSIIDMGSVLKILDELLDKIGFVIKFIGAFSILTGIIVLISSLMISKYQRIRENVLLQTLGATKRQVAQIVFAEYLFLGLFSALTGLLIALVATALLAAFVFEVVFIPPFGFIAVLILSVTALTIIIGVLNSLSTLNRPPLEVLRKE